MCVDDSCLRFFNGVEGSLEMNVGVFIFLSAIQVVGVRRSWRCVGAGIRIDEND